MTDPLSVTLVAAAILVPLDLVRNSQSLERARTHDRAILYAFFVAALAVNQVDVVPGLVLAIGLLGYYREGSFRNLLLAAGLAAVWLLAPLLTPTRGWLALGWLALALLEALVTLWFWGAAKGWWPARTTLAETLPLWPLGGFRGQHTLFAAGLALLLPFAWRFPLELIISATPPFLGYHEITIPALGVVWILMLIGISSWVGVLAGLTGLAVVDPRLTPFIIGAILTALAILVPRFVNGRDTWLNRLPRGDSLDSVKERLRTWTFLLGTMRRWSWRTWLTGRGWDGTGHDLLRAHLIGATKGQQGTAHNDVLDLVYANGLLGLLALILVAVRLSESLRLGDPWSAAVVAGLVIGLGSHALRYPSVGLVWWLSCAFVAWRA